MYKNKTDIDLIIRKVIEIYNKPIDIKVFNIRKYYFIVIGSCYLYITDIDIRSEEDIELVAKEIIYKAGLNNEINFSIERNW